MKVNIGPFINHWNTRRFEDWYMKKRTGKYSWELEDEDYTKFDRFITDTLCDFWQGVLNLTINKINAKRKRKVKVHIDGYDCWNADHTLSLIILPVLKRLQTDKHGAPFVDDEDVPVDIRSSADPNWSEEDLNRDGSTDEFFFKRWDYVMNEMIWAFEQMVDEDAEDKFHTGEIDIKWTPVDKDGNEVPEEGAKLYRMDKGPNDTHVFDRKGYEEFQNRQANGFRLFGKYYRGLWD